MLTQKLLVNVRKEFDPSVKSQFIKSWIETLPKEDIGTILYWDKLTANMIDSKNIKSNYSDVTAYYTSMYQ
jgi:hypothetical protein